MKIFVIGSGGREHAIVWKLRKDDPGAEIFVAPGNAGTAQIATNIPIPAGEITKLTVWAWKNRPDLTIIGPEVPLCLGLADKLTELGIPVFGPGAAAAKLEGSKAFAKEIMEAAQVPTARSRTVANGADARAAIAEFGGVPVVLKADGLAAGKGVSVCTNTDELETAIKTMFVDKSFGEAATQVVVEEFLEGEEASVLAFVDGTTIVPLPSAQDHKRLLTGDKGPNTGGMGAYSPAPRITPDMLAVIHSRILAPVVAELAKRGIVYKGVLYAGIMLTENGPKVLEFNCRFGDPETQVILPRMVSPLAEAAFACVKGTLAGHTPEWSPEPCVCVVMVAGGYPGAYAKGDHIRGIDKADKLPDVKVFHAGTEFADGRGGAPVTAGGRVLGVTATGNTVETAVRQAYQGVLKIKFDGAYYRNDIAHRAMG